MKTRLQRRVTWACTLACLLLGMMAAASDMANQKEFVSFVHYFYNDYHGAEAMVARAMQVEPGLDIKPRAFQEGLFKVNIQAMLEGEAAPDLFANWAGQSMQGLVDKGVVTPVDDVWDAHQLDSRFPPAIEAASTYNGVRYAVPITFHWTGFFYNKKVFASLGLQPPATWEEFLEVCAALRKAGITPIAMGLQNRWPAQFWFDFLLLRTAGPDFRAQLLRGEASFTDPRVKRAVAVWQELVKSGAFMRQPGLYDWAGAAKAMHGGQAAMVLDGTWLIGYLERALGWKGGEDFGAFAFPVMDPALPRVDLRCVDLVAVAARGKQAEGRRALAALTDPAAQFAMSQVSGAMAASKEVSIASYAPLKQHIARYIERAEASAFYFDQAAPTPLVKAGLDAFVAFHKGQLTADAMLQRMQDATDGATP